MKNAGACFSGLNSLALNFKRSNLILKYILDGCKARNRHRKTIANLKMRAKSLIELINAKPGAVFVTEEHRITGFFPWQNSSDGFGNLDYTLKNSLWEIFYLFISISVSVADDFKVVDVWMLLKRFQEEIPQTRKEMKSFYLKISKDILNLSQDINALSGRKIYFTRHIHYVIILYKYYLNSFTRCLR